MQAKTKREGYVVMHRIKILLAMLGLNVISGTVNAMDAAFQSSTSTDEGAEHALQTAAALAKAELHDALSIVAAKDPGGFDASALAKLEALGYKAFKAYAEVDIFSTKTSLNTGNPDFAMQTAAAAEEAADIMFKAAGLASYLFGAQGEATLQEMRLAIDKVSKAAKIIRVVVESGVAQPSEVLCATNMAELTAREAFQKLKILFPKL